MKKTLITIAILTILSCSKQEQPTICEGLGTVICTHYIVNSWQICSSPHTGKDSIYSYNGHAYIDTIPVCDTTTWLNDKRDLDRLIYELCEPETKWLIEATPNYCGCE